MFPNLDASPAAAATTVLAKNPVVAKIMHFAGFGIATFFVG